MARIAVKDSRSSSGQLAKSPLATDAVRGFARVSRMLENASTELSLAHYRVLSAIASGDERASRIATKLSLGKPTVSASVDALCKRGLLTRSVVGGDQRAVALAVTADGAAALARAEEAMVASVVDLCQRTSDPRRALEAFAWLGPAIDAAVHTPIAAERVPDA